MIHSCDEAESSRAKNNQSTSPEVPRLGGVCYREFVDEYVRPNKPVIITDAIDHWPAMRRWTPDFFRDEYGSMDVEMDGLTMSQFIDKVEQSAAGSADNLPYFRNRSIHQTFPELAPDISPLPIYLQPNWFNNQLVPKRISRHRTDIFIGGVGSRFPYLHWDNYHGYAFLFQIYGEKTYILYPPEQSPFLYPKADGRLLANVCSIEDIENPDAGRFPLFARATPTRCVLGHGEMMFMPSGWWHTARMDTPSISVSSNTANAYNWSALMCDHWQNVTKHPLKAMVGAVYLRMIWLMESSKDLLYRNRKLLRAHS